MSREDGRAVLEAFRYVDGIYRTAAQLVAACDPVLGGRGFLPYVGNWRAIYVAGKHQHLAHADRWLPRFVIRQYHQEGNNDAYLALGAVLWYPGAPLELPVGLASRLTASNTGDDIYWVSILQCLAAGCPADGVVRTITPDDVPDAPREVLYELRRKVQQASLRSVAVPLLDLTCPADVDARLLTPLLA